MSQLNLLWPARSDCRGCSTTQRQLFDSKTNINSTTLSEFMICWVSTYEWQRWLDHLLQSKNLETILVLPLTHSEKILPHMLIVLRILLPRAGNPQLLQSGPIIATALMFMFMATQRHSLRQTRAAGGGIWCGGIWWVPYDMDFYGIAG